MEESFNETETETDTDTETGMKPEHKEAIKTHVSSISTMEPKQIIPHLYGDGTISFNEKLQIDKIPSRVGRTTRLVDILLNGGPSTFDGFIRGLNKIGSHKLASKLKTTAENNVNKTTETPPAVKIPKVSMVVGGFDKKNVRVNPAVVPPFPRNRRKMSLQPINDSKTPSPEPVVEQEEKMEESATPEPSVEDKSESDDSFQIYETLKKAHKKMKEQVSKFLPLFKKSDKQGSENIQSTLASQMQKVEAENARLEVSSNKDKKIFNRDMLILIINMNEVLDFMKHALMNLASSLQKNEIKYKETIANMKSEIRSLQKALDEKNEQLTDLQRDNMAFGLMERNDMKKAIQALNMAAQQQTRYLRERDKREQEDRQRQARKEREAEAERERQKQEEEKEKRMRREEEIKENERMKLELEEHRQREKELLDIIESLRGSERERDQVELSSLSARTPPLSSRSVYIPRTTVPKLPVIGRSAPKVRRQKKS